MWGGWAHQENWREEGVGEKEEWPNPITVAAVENRTSTSLEIGGVQTTLDEIVLSAKAETLWGGWETGYLSIRKLTAVLLEGDQ